MQSIHYYLQKVYNWLEIEPQNSGYGKYLDVAISGLILLVTALLPFQLKKLLFTQELFMTGKFDPFSSVFLYLHEILIVVLLCLVALKFFISTKTFISGNKLVLLFCLLFLIFAEATVFFSENKLLSYLLFWQFFLLFIFYLILIQGFGSFKKILTVLLLTMSMQAIIGIAQYWKQGSIGLHFLGEPHLAQDAYGIAKIDVFDQKRIRAYGTFEHPNIFAGLLTLSFFFSWFFFLTSGRKLWLLNSFFQFAGVFVSFSRTALFVALCGMIVLLITYLKQKRWLIFVTFGGLFLLSVGILLLSHTAQQRLLALPSSSELRERFQQITIAGSMILDQPLGVGAGNFTLVMGKYFGDNFLLPWNFQPVHNIFLLIASELGVHSAIFVLIFFIVLITISLAVAHTFLHKEKKILAKILLLILSAIFVLGVFDHYFYTSFQAQLFLVYVLAGFTYLQDKDKKSLPAA